MIVQDPNNTSVLYAGTGESYTTGDAAGNGIYKSTNGGNNWSLVFGQGTSGTVTQTNSNNTQGAFFVNDIILYDHDKNPATDAWIFAALAGSFSSRSYGSQNTILDSQTYGLYKSTDAGGSFSLVTSVNNGPTYEVVNDLEVQEISNRIWLSTTTFLPSQKYGTPVGGRYWYSDDGNTFTRATPNYPAYPVVNPDNIQRTEIAPSAIDTDTHYILMRVSGTASGTIPIIYKQLTTSLILLIYNPQWMLVQIYLELLNHMILLEVNHLMI